MSVIVPGVILAAGDSTRMGQPKALLPTASDKETFVVRLIRTLRLAGVDDVLVVLGRRAALIEPILARVQRPPRVLINDSPDRGQLSSLHLALRTADHPGVGGLLVTLVDSPLVTPVTVRRLLETHRQTRAPVVRPVSGSRHGHPVIFDRLVFDELRAAGADGGAKTVVRRHQADAIEVPVDDEGAFLDIDTPDEYERVFGRPVPR